MLVRLDDAVVAAVVGCAVETDARADALVVSAVVATVVGADEVARVVVTVVAGGRDEACAPTLQLGSMAFLIETTSCSPLLNAMVGHDLCTPDLESLLELCSVGLVFCMGIGSQQFAGAIPTSFFSMSKMTSCTAACLEFKGHGVQRTAWCVIQTAPSTVFARGPSSSKP